MRPVPAMSGRIESVRVGRTRVHQRPAWDKTPGATWTSAYVKDEVAGPVPVGTFGLEGDEQYELESHGGPDNAVLMYPLEHYAGWRKEPGLERIGPGGFAENLTVTGFDEARVCIGDVIRAGGATLQVSQPRGPCANIARHWNVPTLLAQVTEVGRAGWYLRVLEPGAVKIGDPLALIERPLEGWTVQRVFRLRIAKTVERDVAAFLAKCPQLSVRWRGKFADKLAALSGA